MIKEKSMDVEWYKKELSQLGQTLTDTIEYMHPTCADEQMLYTLKRYVDRRFKLLEQRNGHER